MESSTASILNGLRHAMLLQHVECVNMYAGMGHSNTKYNTKYNFLPMQVWETHSADLQN